MNQTRKHLLARMTAPASEPVTLAEAKLYLRVDNTADDTLIGDMIVAARMAAEHFLRRSLVTQAWKVSYDDYVDVCTPLPMGPVTAITAVESVARDGSTQTVATTAYTLNAAQDAVNFDFIVIGFRVDITYATGYGSASAVPAPIKQGLLAHIASMYDTRGESVDFALPPQAMRLYMPYREVRL